LVTVGLIAFGGTAQLIVPTVGALFWKRSNAPGAITGLLGGLIFTILFTFVPGFISPFGLDPAMCGLVLNAILFIVVSLLTNPRDKKTVERFEAALSEFKYYENKDDKEVEDDKVAKVN